MESGIVRRYAHFPDFAALHPGYELMRKFEFVNMTTPLIPQDDFNEITQLIHAARQRAVHAVNTALIE